jgi:hypothetical protein
MVSTALMNKGLLTAQPQLLEECATYASGHKLIYRLNSVQPALHSITDAARPLRLLRLVPNSKSHNRLFRERPLCRQKRTSVIPYGGSLAWIFLPSYSAPPRLPQYNFERQFGL